MAETEEEEIRTVTLSPWAPTRIMILISAAAMVALVLMFLLTNGGRTLFTRHVTLRTYLADATGLIRTAPVELNGITVGEIKSVHLTGSGDPARSIVVEMEVEKNYLSAIPEDSQGTITADNLLGDKYINITKGKSSRSVQPDAEIRLQPPTNDFDPGDLLASMQTILRSVDQTLTQIETPDNDLGKFVNGEDLYQQLLGDVTQIQQALAKYTNPRSEIGQAVFGQNLYIQLRQPFLDLDTQLSSIQNGQGAAGRFYASTEQYDQLRAKIAQFRSSLANLRAQPMMRDDEMYQKLLATIKSLGEAMDALNGGQGTLGELLTSSQLYESLNGSSREMRDFLREFRLNPQKFLRVKIF